MRKKILLATTAVVAVFAFAVSAEAGGRTAKDSRDAEIQELKARLDRLEQQQADDQRAEQDAAVQEQSRLLKLEKNPSTNFNNGLPSWVSADGAFSASIKARVHLDMIDYSQSASDFNVGTPAALKDLSDGINFRRVYFGVAGKFLTDFEYELRLSFGGDGDENSGCKTNATGGNSIVGCRWINLARVAYTGIPNFKFNVGAIEPIFTLADSTSSGDLPFLERPSVVAAIIGPFGGDDSRKGLEMTYEKTGAIWGGDNVLISAAYTGGRTGTNHDDTTGAKAGDEGTQVLGRIADRIYSDPDTNIQIGASAGYVLGLQGDGNNPGFARTISFSDFPEMRMDANKLINSGNIVADHATLYGLEAAANWKFLYLDGEYYNWTVHRQDGLVGFDPRFSGFYAQGTWVITGESKGYSASKGVWGSPKADHPFDPVHGTGWGAFELAVRYSDLDLNSNEGTAGFATPLGGIRGGEQKVETIGMNWYLNNYLKMQLDYEWVKVDQLTAAGAQSGQKLNILGTRMALNF